MKNWKAIGAMSLNKVIGINNTLPWKLPAELEWFRKTTAKSMLVMGRKTYDSLIEKNPESLYIVLTRNKSIQFSEKNVVVINSPEEIGFIKNDDDKEIWICGGAQLYTQVLNDCCELYLSIINAEYMGDSFFPEFEDTFLLKDVIHRNDDYSIHKYVNKRGG